MYKKKPFFITFEGIEGSGKSYHSKILFLKLKKMNLPVVLTREPGGTRGAEQIRKVILSGEQNKFDKITDTFLYIAARNENLKKNILPKLSQKKIVICDRFTDSTIAYQVYGLGVDRKIIDLMHKNILKKLKIDLTFILDVDLKTSSLRINKRKKLNRYEKLKKNFYKKVKKGFINISKSNKRKYILLNTKKQSKITEDIILNKVLKLIKYDQK